MFKKLLFISVLVLLLLPSFAFAIDIPGWPLVPCGLSQDNPATPFDETESCGRCDLFQLLKNLIDFVIGGLMPPLAVLLFVWAGFLILLSGANPGLYAQGQTIFKNTFYGIMILLSAWMITNTLILSVGAKYNNAGNWWQFTCTEPAPVSPPTFKYSCNQSNQCVVDSSGTYTTSNCDNQCQVLPTIKYDCNAQGQCVRDPNGQYTTPTCNNFCQPGTTFSIITANLSNGTVSQPYNQVIQVSGGTAPYAWTQLGSLPAGLSFNAATGVILGTPTATGTSTFTIKVTDQSTPPKLAEKQLSIVVGTTQPPVGGNCSGVQCSDSNLNVCGQNTSANCSESAVNKWDTQIKAAAANNQVGSGIDTVALVKAIMSQESGGRTDQTSFEGTSHGIMQMRPETANQYKSGCTSANITAAWLKDQNNVQANICVAINYMKSLLGPCGTEIRNIAAGYNGGGAAKGACAASTSCASCSMCGNETTRRWECLWDGPDGEHKSCNVERKDPTTGRPDNFSQTRKYAPSVAYCYTKFGGLSTGGTGGGTTGGGTTNSDNLTLSSISPTTVSAGTEKSFDDKTGVVEYTYLEVPFEIQGQGLTGSTLSSNNTGVDGKTAIEFKNPQITDTSIKGTMLVQPTAKDSITTVTVRNGDKTATKDIAVTVTGTQYLKRKFASNAQVLFKGNYKEVMPNQDILDLEKAINDGLRTVSTPSYKKLDLVYIIHEESFFLSSKPCGPNSAGANGCADDESKFIWIKGIETSLNPKAQSIFHETVHKLHFYNLGIYGGIPDAPKVATNLQQEWDSLTKPADASTCRYLPLKSATEWNDGTDWVPHCSFARSYGAYLYPNDPIFYEDMTTMAQVKLFRPDILNESNEVKNDRRYDSKINLLRKYEFLQ